MNARSPIRRRGCISIFSIHQRAHFLGLLGHEQRFPVTLKSNSTELYFETEDIEAAQARLRQAGAEFVHAVQEQPWGQRVMRVYDPDGHILEIGETLDAAMARSTGTACLSMKSTARPACRSKK